PDVRALVGPFDEAALCHPWEHPDPRVDALQREIEAMVREATAAGVGRAEIFDRALHAAERAAGERVRAERRSRDAGAVPHVPREPSAPRVRFLTEPWYC